MKKFIILISILSINSVRANYCAGIRGNGELAPAHWSALAKIIEHKGMPQKVSGGSSAAITQFLLDGVSRNKNATDNDKQALLMKSLLPHITYLIDKDVRAPLAMDIVADFSGAGKRGFFKKLKGALRVATNFSRFKGIIGEYGRLINPEIIYGLKKNFKFTKEQAMESIDVLGSFDAKNDQNIFFRKGVVDFRQLGMFFGRIADFSAGYGKAKVNAKLNTFLNACSKPSRGKTWDELVEIEPDCKTSLYSALKEYYKPARIVKRRRWFPNIMIFEKVGSSLLAYPTTAVVHSTGAQRYKKLLAEYVGLGATDFTQFSLDYDSELEYGYWGDKEGLDNIEKGLLSKYPNDTKSSKFSKLNGGTWFEVLATSPAEPGLANLQQIPLSSSFKKKKMIKRTLFGRWRNDNKERRSLYQTREGVYSAGGWSDLHPTLVLKASGCTDIIYITRQGGESVFGQQIFIRLTGYADKISFWENIREFNRVGFHKLTSVEMSSPWNKLYNLANPDSSYNLSVKEASGVYCTDWDQFNVFTGQVAKAIDDSYSAPLFLKDETRRGEFNFGLEFEGRSVDGFPGCLGNG